ncbi:hypothetical protein FA15DRAFT_652975 [Coprinopsis marcescibilis]|uniref:Mid2 domain-containing protein n=1 Tax=Coprinopsis marcescibilis TaxID=230819 RepID=A0A5C3L6H5_COPMA|nr:hypothetical protein FA15DRAFT_652975 [Coprinopsis marcescibilis]
MLRNSFLFHSVCTWLVSLTLAQTLRNVSIDDQDPAIQYIPPASWRRSPVNDWDAGEGRTHMSARDARARAEFNFTGIALYYYSPRWPSAVATGLSVDDEDITVDQTDYDSQETGRDPTRRSRLLATFADLENTQHSVRVFVPDGYEYATVDYFVYTEIVDAAIGNGTANNTDSSPGGAVNEPTSTSTPVEVTGVPIVGLVLGAIGVLAILFCLGALIHRQNAREAARAVAAPKASNDGPNPMIRHHSSRRGVTRPAMAMLNHSAPRNPGR